MFVVVIIIARKFHWAPRSQTLQIQGKKTASLLFWKNPQITKYRKEADQVGIPSPKNRFFSFSTECLTHNLWVTDGKALRLRNLKTWTKPQQGEPMKVTMVCMALPFPGSPFTLKINKFLKQCTVSHKAGAVRQVFRVPQIILLKRQLPQ